MSTRHSMMYEGRGKGSRGKRKAVKTKKGSGQRSAISRKVRAAKRTALNILGGIGFVAVVIWIFQFIASGGG